MLQLLIYFSASTCFAARTSRPVLTAKGYSKTDILLLYKFIDWLINLPEELGKKFHEEIIKYEEARKMPYITTAERIGMEKGIQQGIKQGIQQGIRQGLLEAIELGLKLKFGTKGLKLYPQITKIDDIGKLRTIYTAPRFAWCREESPEVTCFLNLLFLFFLRHFLIYYFK